ncbi:hypothetical protein IT571_11750 [Candidatus Sumerlaeota bacterium]|nr:hypothetical protein [Candidatus Sumerlaeota bacterium]
MFTKRVFQNSMICVAMLALAEVPLSAADWIYVFKQDVNNGNYVVETIRAVDPATGNAQVISGYESAPPSYLFSTSFTRYRNASGPTYFFGLDGPNLVVYSIADGATVAVEEFRGPLNKRTNVQYVAPDKFFVSGYIVDLANDTVTGSPCDSCYLEPGTSNILTLSGRTVARVTEAGVSTDLFTIPSDLAGGYSESGLKFEPIGDGKAILGWSIYLPSMFVYMSNAALVSYTDTGYTEIRRDSGIGDFAYVNSDKLVFLKGDSQGGTLTHMDAASFTKIGSRAIPGFQNFSKFPGGAVTYSAPEFEPIDSTHRRETIIATIYEAGQSDTDLPIELVTSTSPSPLRRGNGPQFPNNGQKILVSPAGDKLYMGYLGSVMTIDVATGDRTLVNLSGLDLHLITAVGPAVELSSRDIPTLSDMTNHLTGEQALPESKLPNADMNTDSRIDTGDLQITADQ